MAPREALAPPQPTPDADDAFVHYYDQHPTREDLMGESIAQSTLIFYLLKVLTWLYRAEGWLVVSNLNIYRERRRDEYPLAPDVAVFKGVVLPSTNSRTLRSWRLYEPGRPPPQVVFEISSDDTWKDDLREKPAKYAALGVQEYYAYDPNDPPYWPKRMGRLRGWQLVDGIMVERALDGQGRLWSVELASWLVPDGAMLRLHDVADQRRLTGEEAAEAERTTKEAARLAEATERAAKEAAWTRLRALGINPEEL
jgi:Uma2 family endonuclease